MGFVVKITSFLYRYLNGRDEKKIVKKLRTRGDRVLEGRVLRGDYCTYDIATTRAVHVQSFQSTCTCTVRPALPSDFIPFDRANQLQELNNAFLDESLAQKEAKLWSWKVVGHK